MFYKPLTDGEKQAVRFFDVRALSEDFIKNTCQPEYLKARTPEAREFWTNQARKSKERADRLLFNPDTHCGECGEFLSLYGHCWQCHWPPMDPKQHALTPPPCDRCHATNYGARIPGHYCDQCATETELQNEPD